MNKLIIKNRIKINVPALIIKQQNISAEKVSTRFVQSVMIKPKNYINNKYKEIQWENVKSTRLSMLI